MTQGDRLSNIEHWAAVAATLVDLAKRDLPPHISEAEQVEAYLGLKRIAADYRGAVEALREIAEQDAMHGVNGKPWRHLADHRGRSHQPPRGVRMTGPLFVVAAVGTAGFAVLLWQLRKATTAPLTATDRWCSHVDQALGMRGSWRSGRRAR